MRLDRQVPSGYLEDNCKASVLADSLATYLLSAAKREGRGRLHPASVEAV